MGSPFSAFMMATEVCIIFSENKDISKPINPKSLFLIGNEVADYVREHLIGELKKMDSFKNKDYRKALEDIYIKMDLDIQSTEGQEKLRSYQKKGGDQGPFGRGAQGDIADAAGCTACSALITPTEIWVANAGDSRAVIGKKRSDGKYEAFAMSEDHKPDNEGEKKRIEEAGGFVEDNRVRGILALSRSIGDLEYKVKGENKNYKKDMITADPEIKIQKIEPDVSFLIIACDGIWDCLDNQQAVDKVGDLIAKKPKLSQVVEDVFDQIIAPDVSSSGGIGCDNMTAIIVQFK